MYIFGRVRAGMRIEYLLRKKKAKKEYRMGKKKSKRS